MFLNDIKLENHVNIFSSRPRSNLFYKSLSLLWNLVKSSLKMKNILRFLIFNSWVMILFAISNELNLFKVEVEEENRSVYHAIFDVIFELFVRRGVFFEIIIFGQLSDHANDIVDEVFKKFEGTRPMSVFKYDSVTHLDESAVIFFDWNLTKSKNFSFDLNFKQSSKFFFFF